MAKELVSFVGLSYPPMLLRHVGLTEQLQSRGLRRCSNHQRTAVLLWLRQTQRLASLIGSATSWRTSVHMYTTCYGAAASELLTSFGWHDGAGAPIVIHETVDSPLLKALEALRAAPSRWPPAIGLSDAQRKALFRASKHLLTWGGAFTLNVLKWVIVSAVHAELVVFLDLDMEPLPQQHASEAGAIDHWVSLFRCVQGRNESFFSLSDHSTPVNTAYMIVKPNASLYEEGIAALMRAAGGAFNRTHGWDLVGPPREVVPPADPSWIMLRRKRLEIFTLNDWTFVCADIDQGFFFYMYRVRHQAGADLLLNTRCQRGSKPTLLPWTRRTARAKARGATNASVDGGYEWWRPDSLSEAFLHHYAGGRKPETMMTEGQACDKQEDGLPARGVQSLLGVQLVTTRDPSRQNRRTTRLESTGVPPERNAWELVRGCSN